jgi:hypothetical protein
LIWNKTNLTTECTAMLSPSRVPVSFFSTVFVRAEVRIEFTKQSEQVIGKRRRMKSKT